MKIAIHGFGSSYSLETTKKKNEHSLLVSVAFHCRALGKQNLSRQFLRDYLYILTVFSLQVTVIGLA
jgi:hypothetical protein